MRKDPPISVACRFVLLVLAAVVMLAPLIWLLPTSLKSVSDIFANVSSLLPESPRWSNFREAWQYAPFAAYYRNTIIITFGTLAVQLVTVTFAAYAFARIKFPGRQFLFFAFLTQLMLTPQTTVLPNYFTIAAMGLLDTTLAVAMPYFASAFGIFLMRQAFLSLPLDLEEAAYIDGANVFQIIWHVLLPMVRSSLLAFSIFSIAAHWNEFFWPLIITETEVSRPLTVGLAMFAQQAESGAQWGLLMAATLIVSAPLLVAFIVFQRQFVQSFVHSGLKG